MKLALALWLSTSVLAVQTEGPLNEKVLSARALMLLRSEQLSDKAWGVYLCGGLLVPDCSASLVTALDKARTLVAAPQGGEEFFYVQALLDNLIRLGAVVPTELIMQFDPRWRDEVVILLARDFKAEAQLLKLERQELTIAQWIAVNNLLLRIRSEALFVRMLEGTRIEHFFEVFDAEPNLSHGSGIGDGLGGMQLPIRKVPAGFPPVGIYELHTSAAAGTTVVASGPCGTYGIVTYLRTEITEAGTEVAPRKDIPAVKPVECRNAYLAAFENRPEAAVEIFRPVTRIRWTTAADFSRETSAAMDANARALQAFVRHARITKLALPATLTIDPIVSDYRAIKRVRLPAIPPRKVTLN